MKRRNREGKRKRRKWKEREKYLSYEIK